MKTFWIRVTTVHRHEIIIPVDEVDEVKDEDTAKRIALKRALAGRDEVDCGIKEITIIATKSE